MYKTALKISLVFFIIILSTLAHGQKIVKLDAVMLTTGKTKLHDDSQIAIFGFSSNIFTPYKLPARTLYANEGDSVVVVGHNHSRDPHTIHLHGTDVDTRNDGDPMTSFSIDHDQDTTYSFRANHAGTYIYHCHFQDVLHLQMGMYGLLIIKAAEGKKTAWTGGPAYTKEYAWLTSEIDKFWHDTYEVVDAGHNNTVKHPKYRPNYFVINGKSQQQLKDSTIAISGSVGDKIYVRLANIGFYINNFIFPASLNATVIDSDGRPLPTSIKSDTVEVMPGERYGVMLTPTADITENVVVNFINMNTYKKEGIENIPLTISQALGIEDQISANGFFLSPNPAIDQIKLSLNEVNKINSITIVNSIGHIIETVQLSTSLSEYNINTSNLPQGLYCIRANTETGVMQKSFIIQR